MTVYNRMFPFITKNHKRSGDTWNPLGGKCLHKCFYCWVKDLKQRYPNLRDKYNGKPRIYQKELNRAKKFTEKDFIFACDCTDLFGMWIPRELIETILNTIEQSPAKFLLLTKNPERYRFFKMPKNCVLGATIETDLPLHETIAPPVSQRLLMMLTLNQFHSNDRMISIEPIMDFSPDFISEIIEVKPSFVAVGYDNYNNKGLYEPPRKKTELLIKTLEDNGIKVYRKTIREAHF